MDPNDKQAIAEELLRESKMFEGLDLDAMVALVSVMNLKQEIPTGTLLFNKDDPGDEMYVILDGSVRIFISSEDGSEFTIRNFGEGEIFGEFTLLDQKTRSTSADVSETATLLTLDRDTFLEFMKTHAAIGLRMMRNLAGRIRYTTNYLQAVVNATKLLSESQYKDALSSITDSPNPDIHNLHSAFVDMITRVQEREENLQARAKQKTDSSEH